MILLMGKNKEMFAFHFDFDESMPARADLQSACLCLTARITALRMKISSRGNRKIRFDRNISPRGDSSPDSRARIPPGGIRLPIPAHESPLGETLGLVLNG
jgi:hypothetical protein